MAAKCELCGAMVDGFNGQMVMLNYELWKQVSSGSRILCVDCIERNLGRELTMEDLLYKKSDNMIQWIPVNYQFIRGKEIGIKNAREELYKMRIGMRYMIPFDSYNPENINIDFNRNNVSVVPKFPLLK